MTMTNTSATSSDTSPLVNCRVQYGKNGDDHSYIALYNNGAIFQPVFKRNGAGCPIAEVGYEHIYSAEDSPKLPRPGEGMIVQHTANHGTILRWIGGSRVEIIPLTEMEIKEFCSEFWDKLPDLINHWNLYQERWKSYRAQESLDHWKWVKDQLLRFSRVQSDEDEIKELLERFGASFEEQFCPVWQDVAKKHKQPEYMKFRTGNLEKNNWQGIGYVLRKFKGELSSRNHKTAAMSVEEFLKDLEKFSNCRLNW